jgi:hypothetical protein
MRGTLRTLRDVLNACATRPDRTAHRDDKIKYAVRFANSMAICIANGVRDAFSELKDVQPYADGTGMESSALAVRGVKKLDVNFSDPMLGLGLGISLKSVHFRDISGGHRYTHNRKRNDEELRAEASGYHQRQPYAVLVAVIFLPFDACEDAKGNHPSSFGSWVQHLRPLAGRNEPHQDIQLFEKVFIGLYDPEGPSMEFFDVLNPPPRAGKPRQLLTFTEFLHDVHRTFERRNNLEFQWAEDLRS